MGKGYRSAALAVLIGLAFGSGSVLHAKKTVKLFVESGVAPGGDGSRHAPFGTVADAVAAGRTAWLADDDREISIDVAPGAYVVNATIEIDYPVEIKGANEPEMDHDDRPTGLVQPGTETRLIAGSSLGTNPIVRASSTDDVSLDALTIDHGGAPVGSDVVMRDVQDFRIRNSKIIGGNVGGIGLELYASSGDIKGNYVTGLTCGACIDAGDHSAPANLTIKNNRIVENFRAGLLLNGGAGAFPLAGATRRLTALVKNNDLSRNAGQPRISAGLRIILLAQNPAGPVALAAGFADVTVRDNTIHGNQIGVTVDAGFPVRSAGGVCENREFTGTVALSMRHNDVAGNLASAALLSFTRDVASVNTAARSAWQYLHDATVTIDDPDASLFGYWLDHPERDPFLGPCPGDAANELLGNQLTINGVTILNGFRVP